MSNLLFPKIKGLAWDVVMVPTTSTEIQQSLAGREVRIQNFVNPIWEFTLHYEYLLNDPRFRDENENTPLETLIGFWLARGGQFDDFLLNLTDLTGRLEDSVYSGQPIGTGDGSTKSFQIVRNIGGFLEAVQNPMNQVATVYVNGAAKVQGTDYTIANGLVTFVSAPAAAAAITADFIFLYRVRFDLGTSRSNSSSASGTKEGIELNNFYYNLWECKEVQLVSVRK
ncbi:MAG TPA: DUF2460 domain-containing protein [Candidatus Angelobacter sp.]|nr:DUF2460 domain-containing protein [Candidatus Angelobacter sp.]